MAKEGFKAQTVGSFLGFAVASIINTVGLQAVYQTMLQRRQYLFVLTVVCVFIKSFYSSVDNVAY